MPKKKVITIDSILGGIGASDYFLYRDQFSSSCAIDPDMPVDDSGDKACGLIRPTSMAVFSGTNVNVTPLFIMTDPKSALVHVFLSNGRIVSYTSSFASETLIASTFTVTIASPGVFSLTAHGLAANDIVYFSTTGALPTGLTAGTAYYVISAGLTVDAFRVSASEGGAAINTSGSQSGVHSVSITLKGVNYYDNYFYFAKERNIGRYGPLNGTASLAHNYWVTTLSLTALANTTYPSINGVAMPNHVMYHHRSNDRLYICDVLSTNAGALHYVKTKKTTVEGDTNDGSTYNALDFSYGEWPTAIETYQTDLVVALIEGTNTTIIQKSAKLSFWDASSASFTSITSPELKDPLITALKNINGALYVFSGFATGGCRVSKVVSGYSLEEVCWLPEQYPPLPGAVDHFLNRFVFGSNTVEPEVSGSVFSVGAKEKSLAGRMGVHNIVRASTTGANPMVTAVKYLQQSSGKIIQPIIGWKSDTDYGLDKISTTYGDYNVWRSDLFQIGKKFSVNKVKIPLVQAVAANMTLTFKLYFDDGSSTPAAADYTQVTINSTNYPNSPKCIDIYPRGEGWNNFFIQLEWSGTVLLTVALPITIELFIHE